MPFSEIKSVSKVVKSDILKLRGSMEIVILESALKHGISEENILFCLMHSRNDIVIDDPPIKRVIVGFDNVGRALEIVAIEDDDQDRLVVIHAMRLTKKYYFLLNEGE
jgi:hypothetical protein